MAETARRHLKPSDHKFWETYLSVADEEDKFLPGSWEANTTGILTFTGLFAATVAAFLVESYKSLSLDSGDETVLLLRELLLVTANSSAHIPASPKAFQAAPSAIAVNSFWFSSLLISLICALLSTLIQEWARDYRRDVGRPETLDDSARYPAYSHVYVRMGIDRYGMDRAVYLVTALVHLSVLLFVVGLIIFLFSIDGIVAVVAVTLVAVFLVAYAAGSALPLFDPSCPYRTPATYLFAGIAWLLRPISPSSISKSLRKAPYAHYKVTVKKPTVKEMTTRSLEAGRYGSLTLTQFVFAWNRTSRHLMLDAEQFQSIVAFLYSIQPNTSTIVNDCITHLWSDVYFFIRLVDFSTFMLDREPPSGLPPRHDFFLVVVNLFTGMFVFEDEHPDGCKRFRNCVQDLLHVLGDIRCVSENTGDATAKLTARLYILITMYQYFHIRILARRRGVCIPDEYPTLRERRYFLSKELLHPGIHLGWMPTDIMLLHDGTCCNSLSTLTADVELHGIASTVLTAIAHLLEVDPAVREGFGYPPCVAEFYDFKPLDNPSVKFRRNLPSQQFVELLRVAGFEEWLQQGSYFSSGPSPTSVHHDYLVSDGGRWTLSALRKLARCVNWDEYHRLHSVASPSPISASRLIPFIHAAAQILPTETHRPPDSEISDTSAIVPCKAVIVHPNVQGAARVSAAVDNEQATNGEGSATLVIAQSADRRDSRNDLVVESGQVADSGDSGPVVTELVEASEHEDEGKRVRRVSEYWEGA